jgi:RimJ/RimL family protein N-acetyltransferase
MRHDLRLAGRVYGLRPVELDDAEFIVALRTSDPERVRYLHPIPPDPEQQRRWLRSYFERQNDYYFVVENRDSRDRHGLVSIYNVDPVLQTGEWGRWILRPGSFAAVESALLVYQVAFEYLQLRSIYCITVIDNLPVISFHDSCGLARAGSLRSHFELAGLMYDGVKHVCTQENWPSVRSRLEVQVQRIARRLNRSVTNLANRGAESKK